jgi:D-serine deaminase-like pyridoxal phosphate-dependent protein
MTSPFPSLADLPTPALLLDQDVLEANLRRMQERAGQLGAVLRPHIKTHKCIEIARRQAALGARGITVSTFYEAEQFADAGFDDITWAFPIPLVYVPRALELAARITLRLVLDSAEALGTLESACAGSGAAVHVWLKVDCGDGRAGVPVESPRVLELARCLAGSPALRFDGLISHSGSTYPARTRDEVVRAAERERAGMAGCARRLREAGCPVPAVSIGSTPAMAVLERLDGIDEVRPGNYVFHDYTQVALGTCALQDCALTVLASVVSHQPGADRFVVDAGALALSKDPGPPQSAPTTAMGWLFDDGPTHGLDPCVRLTSLSQEHGVVTADSAAAIEGRFRVGDQVRILENHSCLTAALFDRYYVRRAGRVVDEWKILRGRT